VVVVHDQQAAELMAVPVGDHRIARSPQKADHDDRPDLLVKGQAAWPELLGRAGRGDRGRLQRRGWRWLLVGGWALPAARGQYEGHQ